MNKQKSFDIQSVISAFITLDKLNYEKVKVDEKECPNCSMTLKKIKENSRIGCELCYTHFFDELNTLFPKLQNGNTIHRGKTPRRLQCAIALEKAIEQLQVEMQEAVQEEAFERAAEIRDAIKELEQKKQGSPQ
ncbi:MAG: UvrB/UvrC motif-containing protein [Bacilli bacterium]